MIEEHKYKICFSIKFNRIRVNQQTILDMGYPKLVRLLINPETKELAIQPCNSHEKLSFKVPKDFAENKHGFELSSITLTQLLVDKMGWDLNTHYKVYGRYVKKENIVVFSLNEYEEVQNEEYEI